MFDISLTYWWSCLTYVLHIGGQFKHLFDILGVMCDICVTYCGHDLHMFDILMVMYIFGVMFDICFTLGVLFDICLTYGVHVLICV